MTRILSGVVVAIVAVVVVAASALAAGNLPSNDVYSSTAPKIQKVVGALKPPTIPSKPSSSPRGSLGANAAPSKPGVQLPFTGLDLAFAVGAGVVLVAVGFGLHRITRKPQL